MDYIKKQFSGVFDLSPEIVMDLPLIMFVGNSKINIENHKGVIQYTDEQIRVRVRDNIILIKGRKLIIEEIKSDSLSISGFIKGLHYEKEMGGRGLD